VVRRNLRRDSSRIRIGLFFAIRHTIAVKLDHSLAQAPASRSGVARAARTSVRRVMESSLRSGSSEMIELDSRMVVTDGEEETDAECEKNRAEGWRRTTR